MKKILQLDGGGYRGRIETFFLQKLELKLGKPLYQVFDLISGTSTGAVIAGLLCSGVPASKIHSLYVNEGAILFKRNWLYPFKPKYDRVPLVNRIKEVICSVNHDFMAYTKTKLQINAVDIVNDTNVYFKSWKPEFQNLKISEAIQRSFSAAVYFGATISEDERKVYADGGEGNANCTLLECLIEAYRLLWRDEGFYICSIGSGFQSQAQTFTSASKLGLIGQTGEYLTMARNQAVRTQIQYALTVKTIIPTFDFDRLDTEIDAEYDVLDGLKFGPQYDRYGHCLVTEFLNNDLLKKLA